MPPFSILRIAAILLLVSLLGCRRGPLMVPVSGTVSYDGKPLEKGEILFLANDDSAAPDAGPIENGQFSFLAKTGPRTVQIRGVRQVRMTDMGPLMEEFLPTKYNAKSTLTQTITPEGPNEFSFNLLSK